MNKVQLHIGLDDTDSRRGGCTTYTGAVIFRELVRMGFHPLDFPWLVRLNPNIPWKTRGNGAVSLHIAVGKDQVSTVKQCVLSKVEKDCDMSQRATDPAVVFCEGLVTNRLHEFASRALDEVLTVGEARQLCSDTGADFHQLKGSRGLIGALAAIGTCLEKEDTYEIIAYRSRDRWGTCRRLDHDSVARMDRKHHETTFSNRDPETGRILIAPHGPDPVLFGIRGEDPSSLVDAASMIRVDEPVDSMMMFRTNAGTDAHLTRSSEIGKLGRYESVILSGSVESMPWRSRGGHVFFKMSDHSGSITCAAFEPTGPFRNIVLQLVPGDLVQAYGGVQLSKKDGLTVNLEKLQVLDLAKSFHWINPTCNACLSTCESAGRNQGYRCRKCSRHYPSESKIPVSRNRLLRPGTYMPPPRAHRHLTRPIDRLSRKIVPENSEANNTDDWKNWFYWILGGGGDFRTLIASMRRNAATPNIASNTTADTTV